MKPHAEVEEVWPRDGRIRVVGRIHGRRPPSGTESADGWRLLLVLRGTGRRLSYSAWVKDGRFESELPIADLAAAGTSDRETDISGREADTSDREAIAGAGTVEEWDVHLTDGEAELRVGRQLDDIRGKKKIMVFPEQRVSGFSVRPYYTVKDNLSLECHLECHGEEAI
ncbi:hypothetical protein G5C60_46360 [Streptomyces sp. HC44]|uniref:Uncharacterized protein n=1 Tax=Streptomyces scabichelini TaxID=2711217 RepID=A0A6G4VM28_9ACTN|nr:hypothetical protein [Streptomyces scabichelini]NGO14823.1 hypothetical protein [Streptomyces scabichelini]